MKKMKYPSLYQVNTRVWLTELAQGLGRKATLDDVPDAALDQFAEMGFDWIWFLSVWNTGRQAQKISRENQEWQREFRATLPDLQEEDIRGSGFAITGYSVHPDLGGNEALQRLRKRMQKRGLKLMLDFVPNHMAPDHPWVEKYPEYFVQGTLSDLERSPQNYRVIKVGSDEMVFAFGRDPYFPGWPDTLQLDYSNPSTQEAMIQELLRIADQCDGLRCDMAMLVLPEVFEKTWGRKTPAFWLNATNRVREKVPEFTFMAEVYWDLEWTLQQQGFDYTYDKRLYDRLREGHARPIREHFYAAPDYQVRLARFLENHDEPRAAATFNNEVHKAAAVITFLSQGLRFFHQGQFEGRKKRISPHLVRAPKEQTDQELKIFYDKLLTAIKAPIFREGKWYLLEPRSAWDGNNSWDDFIAFAWEGENGAMSLVVVNYASHNSQCYVPLPFSALANKAVRFTDLMSRALYDREGNKILSGGIYLDMPAWGYHIFDVSVPANIFSRDPEVKAGEKSKVA